MAKKWPIKPGQYLGILYKTSGRLQLGPISVTASDPFFTQTPDSLPVTYDMLLEMQKKIPALEVIVVDSLPKKEDYIVKLKPKPGTEDLSPVPLKWIGDVKFKHTAYGVFEKDVPKHGLTKQAVRDLVASNKFFVIG